MSSMSQVDTIAPQVAQRPMFVGIDIGGTSIKIGVVDDLGRSISKSSVPTYEERGPAEAMRRTIEEMNSLLARLGLKLEEVGAIGIGSPGPQDCPSGMIIAPDNLPHWKDFAVVDFVKQATGKKIVAFANDANAAAFGECWVGRGREFHSIVMFTLGTGVGGGIIIGDLLLEGDHSAGGELGHIIIDMNPNARMCASGRGHLEGYASATAVVQRAEEALAQGVKTSVRDRLVNEKLTPVVLWEEARSGDRFAYDLIMETADYLGIGVVTLIHVINPGAVIIGGAMDFGGNEDEIGRTFIQRVREVVRRRAFPIPAARTTIDFAQLGGDAGYIGAAGIARFAYHKAKK
jgi:glucokinase